MLFANFHSLKNKNQKKCFYIICEQIAFMTIVKTNMIAAINNLK